MLRGYWRLVDLVETWRGRAVASGYLLIASAVLYIGAILLIRWLGPWFTILAALGLIPLGVGFWGVITAYKDRKERQEERRRRNKQLYAWIEGLSTQQPRKRKRKDSGALVPLHYYQEGKLHLHLTGLTLGRGTSFRCQVLHPNGRRAFG